MIDSQVDPSRHRASPLRIVMFVYKDARHDARVLREAQSLRAVGHTVTIMARPTHPTSTVWDRESVAGVDIVRVPTPQAWRFFWMWFDRPWRLHTWFVPRLATAIRRPPLGWLEAVALVVAGLLTIPWAALRFGVHAWSRGRPARIGGSDLFWLVQWRFVVLAWAELAATAAPEADVWHGHDLSGLEAAGRAQRLRGGALIYDSHEIFIESGSNATRPKFVKAILARSERRWMRAAAALVTVNMSLAETLGRRLHPRRIVVVHNAPDLWDPPSPRPDLIREATGLPLVDPIALYHGGFSAHRGLEELAAALLEPGAERIHAVYMGYGGFQALVDDMAGDPRYGGRVHVLEAVPPNELLPWVASADVGVMAIQPSTENHRRSTPNKLFESLAAGLPVVASDFPEMRSIVMDDPSGPLGAVVDPADVPGLARAIRDIVERPEPEREAMRARCLAAAHARWNWSAEVEALVRLYADLGS